MWYVNSIGSKYKYLKPLDELFESLKGKAPWVIEPFAGTYTVSSMLANKGFKTFSNDIGYWSYCIGRALVRNYIKPTSFNPVENRDNPLALAVYTVALLESVRRVPSDPLKVQIPSEKFNSILQRFLENKTKKIVAHRSDYATFLRYAENIIKDSIVFIDTPKVFKSAPNSVFKYYGKLDEVLRGSPVQDTHSWNYENVVDKYKVLFQLSAALKPKLIVVECFNKAFPSPEKIEEMMQVNWNTKTEKYKNDITIIGELK